MSFAKLVFALAFALSAVLLLFDAISFAQQKMSSMERDRGRSMLSMIKKDVKAKYYDPTFKGVDLDARFDQAEEKIKEAQSIGQVMGIIAQVLLEMNDSHTRFLPPSRANRTEYGWVATMIGDKAIVTAVKPKSDAEQKGLKVGDQIVAVDGINVGRDNLWLMKYLYYTLRPQPGMRLTIVKPGRTEEEELVVLAKITEGQRFMDLTRGDDIFKLIRESER